jgi:hypothetical protein
MENLRRPGCWRAGDGGWDYFHPPARLAAPTVREPNRALHGD